MLKVNFIMQLLKMLKVNFFMQLLNWTSVISHMAEIFTLNWVSSYVEQCQWTNIFQSCEVKEVVKKVYSEAEPTDQDTLYEMITI